MILKIIAFCGISVMVFILIVLLADVCEDAVDRAKRRTRALERIAGALEGKQCHEKKKV
jgi:hypothetical protein